MRRFRLRVLAACFWVVSCATAPQPVPSGSAEAAQSTTGAQKTSDATRPTAAAAGPIHLTLVGTNDHHGWVMPQVDRIGNAELRIGGMAVLASYVSVLRKENPGGVLLLDGGDIFQGTIASNLSEGSVVIDAMNALAYDASTVGNHEFDYGPVGPVSVATKPDVDPFGALKARIAQAKFPLLSTNIYEAENGHRPAWLQGEGDVIIERKGVKIGIFGLTTPQTPTTTVPVNVSSLRFGSLAPEALTAAQRLRSKGAEVVIALAHAGGKCASWDNPKDTSSCDEKSGEVFEMLKGLPPHTIDAVIAGHTHAVMGHFIDGVPTLESWGLGKYFGTIDLYLDEKTHQVIAEKTVITPAIPLCETVDQNSGLCDARALKGKTEIKAGPATFHGVTMKADEKVTAIIEPALQQVAAMQNKSLGLKVPDTLGRNYEDESPLGSFLADSLRAAEKADIALLNAGGLRADLKRGDLTYGAVYEVMPFDNAVATLQLSGDQLKRLLTAAYGSRKGVFQVSGLEVQLSRCPSPSRLKSVNLEGGKALPAEKKYRVVMPDFLARGGDGLGAVLSTIEPVQVDLGENREQNLRDVLVTHWQKKHEGFGAPKKGRVRFLDDSGSCGSGTAEGHQGVP